MEDSPNNLPTTDDLETDVPRIAKLPNPIAPLDFDKWQKVVSSKFPDLVFPAEVALSVIAQLLIRDITNPFALILVGVASSGKTTTINFFHGIEGLTYTTDKFSRAALVSSAANRTEESLKKIDMLPRIRNKMLIIRDLGPTFALQEDSLTELFGTLTRVLDGQGLTVDSATHGRRGYEGNHFFMLLGAVTPLGPKVWKTMSQLGSRLFFLHMKGKEKSSAELADQLIKTTVQMNEMHCAMATREFLYTLWQCFPDGVNWNRQNDDRKTVLAIGRCAKLLAKLRGHVTLWKEWNSDKGHSEPIVEMPDRLNQQLYNFARGRALSRGRTNIDPSDLMPVIEVTIDSAPTNRARVLRQILINGGKIRTSGVMKILHCTHPTAINELETLELLGTGTIHQGGFGEVGGQEKWFKLANDHQWFTTLEFQSAWVGTDTQPPISFHGSPNRESKTTPVSGDTEVSGVGPEIKDSSEA